MQYSPKLKKAMQEIESILKKHDIAGFVVLHTPGNSEYLIELDPSYSCAYIDNAIGAIRVKAKLQEDFGGDKQAWEKKIKDTSNMLSLLSETGGRLILTIMELSDVLDKKVNAEHTGDGHSSHTDQNN